MDSRIADRVELEIAKLPLTFCVSNGSASAKYQRL